MARGTRRTRDTQVPPSIDRGIEGHQPYIRPLGGYEIYDHPADAGVRGWGSTVGEAYANAARALFELVTDPGLVRPIEEVSLDLVSVDREALLVDLLNELIALMDLRNMLLCGIEDAEITQGSGGFRFTGKALGEKRIRSRHIARIEAKAATYSQLRIRRSQTGPESRRWVVQTIIDV